MFHLSCSLEEGDRSEAICCKNRRFSTALKIQIVLVSLLVTFAAALFCLPAKNAYAGEVSEGWEQIGTCEWKVENSTLMIRPANNGSKGELPSLGYELTYIDQGGGYYDTINQWPWSNEEVGDIKKVMISGSIKTGSTLQGLFGARKS